VQKDLFDVGLNETMLNFLLVHEYSVDDSDDFGSGGVFEGI
jgi:hypothetical protein